MQLCRSIAVSILASASVCLGLLAPAAAHAADSAPAAASAADPMPVPVWSSTTLPPRQNLRVVPIAIDAFTCPASHPWLTSELFKPHELVPRGIDVDRGGNVLVKIGAEATVDEETGFVTGWADGANSAANYGLSGLSHAKLTASCTKNPHLAYTPASPDR